jgi:hypothetical protein
MPRRLSLLVLPTLLAAALLASPVAQAHQSPGHWFPISANGGAVTYVDVFTGHCCFYMNTEATFSNVGDACGYLHYIQFYYYNIGWPVPEGGPAWVWSGNGQSGPYFPDTGKAPYYSANHSNLAVVNRWLCGGQTNGRLAALVTKHDALACSTCGARHVSETMYYRP